jgi:pimeloyl-ACP methyl ester carboxylesterase
MSFKDVVILLPGITGSVLARGGREVWSPTVGSVWRAITSLGGSIADLELDSSGAPGDVTAPRLIPDATIVPGFIKIDGYTRIEEYLIARLELEKGRNYFPFPYDWRLDNRVNAERLQTAALGWLTKWKQSSGASDARLVLIGHSMGGLVSRYFLECLEGWKHTRTLITLGTPHQGALNAVDFLVHGMKKGIGPFGLDMSPLLRSYPSVYQLLPIYRCIDTGSGKPSFVADAADSGVLAGVKIDRARDARAFHQQIQDAQAANAKQSEYVDKGYRCIPLVGIEQPTFQSARAIGGRVEMLRSFNGNDDGGDGTVPRVSATPIELEKQDREVFAAEMHGSLQNADGALANLRGLLHKPETDLSRLRAEVPAPLTLDVDDVVIPPEPLRVRARAGEGNPQIRVMLTPLHSGTPGVSSVETLGKSRDGDWRESEFDVSPGTWRVTIEAAGAAPVTDLVAVAEP